jgi:hypothetical protein
MTREFNPEYKKIILDYIQLGPTTFELIYAHATYHIGDVLENWHTLDLLTDLIRDRQICLQLANPYALEDEDEQINFLFAVDSEKTSDPDPEETSDFQHSRN